MPADPYESRVAGSPDPPESVAPSGWPPAWSQLYAPVRDRAVFVAATMFLTGTGLALLGDPAAQWWAIALPLLLLIGPAIRPWRARAALEHAVGNRAAMFLSGRLVPASHGADGWLDPDNGDPTVPLSFHAARRVGVRRAGQSTLLVWHRRHAALVFAGCEVLYLDSRPRGIRPEYGELPVRDEMGHLAGS